MEILNYEELVKEFEDSLLTKLRMHDGGEDYLDLWVPDNDTVKSLINMAEASQLAGKSSIKVNVLQSTLDKKGMERLHNEFGDLGTLSVEDRGDSWIIEFKES